MQRIQKTISLSQFKTLYPLTYPALRDGELSLVNKTSIRLYNNANYATVPFGVNEAVCGKYSAFTEEMGNYYGGKVLDYQTLVQWYKEFQDYYALLYQNPCGRTYSSATHYYSSIQHQGASTSVTYRQMDVDFKRHGGNKFYNWLTNYYFVTLDLSYTYKEMLEAKHVFGVTYPEWQDCIEEIGTNTLYYPAVVQLLSKMALLKTKMADCCSRDKFYKYGGDDLIDVLTYWLNKKTTLGIEIDDSNDYFKKFLTYVNEEVGSLYDVDEYLQMWIYLKINNDTYHPLKDAWCLKKNRDFYQVAYGEVGEWLEFWKEYAHPEESFDNLFIAYLIDDIAPKALVRIPLKKKVADFGNYAIFSTDYNPSKEYEVGNVCTYEDNVYILTGGTGHQLNTNTGRYNFKNSDWIPYLEYYKQQPDHQAEFFDYGENYLLTGRTQSSLISFMDVTKTIDNIGNALPGKYKPSTSSNFIQPPEGTVLDLYYTPGQTINEIYLNTPKFTGFTGDYLEKIEFYYCDKDGIKIDGTVSVCKEGDDVLGCIRSTEGKLASYSSAIDLLKADFTYYKSALYTYDSSSKHVNLKTEIIDGVRYTSGIKYVDHCSLALRNTNYYLSTVDAYPIQYYEVIMDTQTNYSDSVREYVNVNMCDFSFYPRAFQKSVNVDEAWVNKVAAPLIRKEEVLGLSVPEKITDNIYIDRGYATAMDKHLRMGEITSVEALEKYGNGSFGLISSTEDTI